MVAHSSLESRRRILLRISSSNPASKLVVPRISSTPPLNFVRFFVAFGESLAFLGDFVGFLLDLLDFGNYMYTFSMIFSFDISFITEILALFEDGDSTAFREERTLYKAGDGTDIDGDRGDGNSEENEAVGATSQDSLEHDEMKACDLHSFWRKMECTVDCS
ncbi:uncharacterized protein A4U43_C04F21350 [Asparagus officinalis]|uniref:Uncharacterized protein n=1 Tax=Asparagus officinalis TaxID=4686 RepID=A0A5P1F2Q3_ASPOF|nr:uncharacterized protein A4U43_C04F21350 [Asparagus officinalis]